MPLASHEPETIVALGCRALAGQEQSFDTIAQIVDNLGEPSEQP
jgi:hypothetical protein